MSSSPSANYYRPTEEPEPLDLTQLNIEASVMCLVSKVKFLCGRCGSPAVRLRQPKSTLRRGFSNSTEVVTSQPRNEDVENDNLTTKISSNGSNGTTADGSTQKASALNSKDLNLALTAVSEVTRKVKKGNKFTDGLDLSMTTDWASELRPSMRKLRQAMDGCLKTARLMHSVQRLQQDMKKTSANLVTMYRRDVCFSQAVSSGLDCSLNGSTNCFVSVDGACGRLDGQTLGNVHQRELRELHSSALRVGSTSLLRGSLVVVRQRNRHVGRYVRRDRRCRSRSILPRPK